MKAKPSLDIHKFIQTTRKIYEDCSLPNGALIAAPSSQKYYPKDAKDYGFVWPGRDSGYAIAGMSILGEDISVPIISWLNSRAEGFNSNNIKLRGIIKRSYYVNGLIREHKYQPDQGATLIWSLFYKNKNFNKKFSNTELVLVDLICNGYINSIENSVFKYEIEDIWEDSQIRKENGHFTYSLGAVIWALRNAGELLANDKFVDLSEELEFYLLKKIKSAAVLPKLIEISARDITPDSSLLGLVWPFNIGIEQKLLNNTVIGISNELTINGLLHRYPDDKYEGTNSKYYLNKSAGGWPLLNFWMTIALCELGNKSLADDYFYSVLLNLDEDYLIPEQIFEDKEHHKGVNPLLWSHMMGLIAARRLKLL